MAPCPSAALFLAAAVLIALPGVAGAHDFTPGVLSIVERAPGRFEYAWTPPVDSGVELEVTVDFPDHCEAVAATAIDCGARGLGGEIAFPGLRDHRARVVVIVDTLDAAPVEHLVSGETPVVSLDRAPGPSFTRWLQLGVEHIAFGFDHLAFLLGLLLVAGIDRRAWITVTAFTLAHSVTLALAALDLVRLAAGPVEATIAASVVLVAREGVGAASTSTTTSTTTSTSTSTSTSTARRGGSRPVSLRTAIVKTRHTPQAKREQRERL